MSLQTPSTPTKRLRVAFVVQGEGRGHMTQALAVAGALSDAGHEVVRVFVGVSSLHPVPAYFQEGLSVPLTLFPAPVQIPGHNRRGVSVAATTLAGILRVPAFVAGAARVHAGLDRADVDIVVNFMDLVTGVARVLWNPQAPVVAVGHNYLFLHPSLGPLPGGTVAQGAVMGYTRITALGSVTRIALSFGPLPDHVPTRLRVVPPLLRRELRGLKPRDEGHLTAYTLNPGYADVLAAWHATGDHAPMHCFVEGGAAALSAPPPAGFQANTLDDKAFLNSLAGCRAYIGSAGFEAICEAHYLGKPILAVPTEHQYEQTLNAWDAERHGVARAGTYGDLDDFVANLPTPNVDAAAAFRAWADQGPARVVRILEECARTTRI